jgi:hypothetical protein
VLTVALRTWIGSGLEKDLHLHCSQKVHLLDAANTQLYIVHAMKYVTASEARKNWFALLDEALKGEVIAIERKERRLILKLHEKKAAIPDYSGLIDFPDADDADRWGWEWKGPGKLVRKKLVPKTRRPLKK